MIPRLLADPEDLCFRCDGTATCCWFDADLGYIHDACPVCGGVASAGWFLMQLVVGRIRFERSWQSHSYPLAVARANRWADLLGALNVLRGLPAEVHVIYSPTKDRSDPTETVVHAVAVPSRPLCRPAA